MTRSDTFMSTYNSNNMVPNNPDDVFNTKSDSNTKETTYKLTLPFRGTSKPLPTTANPEHARTINSTLDRPGNLWETIESGQLKIQNAILTTFSKHSAAALEAFLSPQVRTFTAARRIDVDAHLDPDLDLDADFVPTIRKAMIQREQN
jgi:hypothetical protein